MRFRGKWLSYFLFVVALLFSLCLVLIPAFENEFGSWEAYRYLVPQGSDVMTVVNLRKLRASKEFRLVTDVNKVDDIPKLLIGKMLQYGEAGLIVELEGIDTLMLVGKAGADNAIAVIDHTGVSSVRFDAAKVDRRVMPGFTVWESRTGGASVASDNNGRMILGPQQLVDEVTRRAANRRESVEVID